MQVFSCKICEIFKNTYFEEDLETTASLNEKSSVFMQLVPFYTPRFPDISGSIDRY